MEKTNRQIVLLRKKKWGEIMGETYRLLSGNYKLLSQLMIFGLVPAIVLPFILIMFPDFSHLFLFLSPLNPLHPGFFPGWGLLKIMAAILFVQLYMDLLPYAFVRNYFENTDTCKPLTFKNTLQSLLRIDLPKMLLISLVLLVPMIVLLPVALYAYIPLMLVMVSYMMQPQSVGKAIKEGFSLGSRYWARTLAGGVAFLFFAGIAIWIFITPYFIMMYASASAYQSTLEGNEAILPWCFGPALFIVCVLMQVVAQVINLFGLTAFILHFFNLKARRAEKLALQKGTES